MGIGRDDKWEAHRKQANVERDESTGVAVRLKWDGGFGFDADGLPVKYLVLPQRPITHYYPILKENG
jgi:hypothetical protein